MKNLLVIVLVSLAMVWTVTAGNYPPIKGGQMVTIESANATDSTYVDTTLVLGSTNGANSAIGRVIVDGPMTAYAGAGLDDSVQIVLKTVGAGRTHTHATKSCSTPPCTLLFAVEAPSVDSTLLNDVYLEVICVDSLSDSAGVQMPYSINWDIFFK